MRVVLYLALRIVFGVEGIKTLYVRVQRACENAARIVDYLWHIPRFQSVLPWL